MTKLTRTEEIIKSIAEGNKDFIGFDLSGLDLGNVKFLQFSNLKGANLEGANLKGANINNVLTANAKNSFGLVYIELIYPIYKFLSFIFSFILRIIGVYILLCVIAVFLNLIDYLFGTNFSEYIKYLRYMRLR